ncbi:hypothetical protein C8J57DRAFT_160750 [Mycena rebaudengoi]|nr:hypothetical protein C8J57DRAFT_160750 [Mycena rebaudengoi]
MPDSVDVLRARLADISTSITRQRKVLEDLERGRADIQRQLNCLLDPIARLPVEISSEIFIHCLAVPGWREVDPTTAPLLLLRICTAWANIARSTPALWDTIYASFPRAKGFEHLFDSYLARSQSRGLALTLGGEFDENMCALLCTHAHRMQQRGPAVNTILPAGSMNLKALKFYPDNNLDLMAVLCMMRAAPGLVECTVIGGYDDDPHADSLTLPCLQSLSVGEDPYLSDLYILKYLSVPALRRLTILAIHDEVDERLLISFLTRLEAPLQSLHVMIKIPHPVAYVQLLNLVPSLTCLWLSWDSPSECTLFLNFLRSSPQGFLAQLRDLTIVVGHLVSDFHPLYDLLSARRSQITNFRFIHNNYESGTPPPPDVLHTLRQLAAECGMKIHFGSERMNYI